MSLTADIYTRAVKRHLRALDRVQALANEEFKAGTAVTLQTGSGVVSQLMGLTAKVRRDSDGRPVFVHVSELQRVTVEVLV